MVVDAFPRAEPGDPEELSWALQTAHSMWSQGDAREAVRWLQRAALTATEIGLNQRGQAIAQLATHLRSTARSQPPGASAPAALQRASSSQQPLAQTHVSPGVDPSQPAVPNQRSAPAAPQPGGSQVSPASTQVALPASAPRQAFRVCVLRNPDGSFHVVPLADGEAARPGTAEALLVELVPGSLAKP